MLKVMHVAEAFGGGVFNYIKDTANWQANRYEVYIVYCVIEKTPNNYREQLDKRIHLVEMPELARSFSIMKNAKSIISLRNIIENIQPDIVHLHSSFAGFTGRWAIDGRKIPLFYSPHAYSFMMQDCSRAKRWLYKTLERLTGKRVCTTIGDCKSEYEESLMVTKDYTYVNNGIDIHELQATIESVRGKVASKQKHDHITVFMMGRICPQKNPEQFNRIASVFPDIKFLWIGDGELREKLNSPNISITGWVSREEAIAHAIQCDVFLFTTLWESLSLALLECMYIKKLCIVMDAEGNRDVIRSGENGFLCYTDDDLIDALRKVVEGNVDVEAITNRAYMDIVEDYNSDIKNIRLAELYKKKIQA